MALDRIEKSRPKLRSGAKNRTKARVHPNSLEAGTFEEEWFYTYAKGELDRLLKKATELLKRKNAIRRLARAEGRALTDDEKLATLITPAALRVLEQLTTLARTCSGKVFPSWKWIEAHAGVSRASVGRALEILSKMGLLEKQRRCVPITPPADRPKARYEQTSNVYRMSFPNRLINFLPRHLRPVPLPDDVVQRESDRIEEIETMRLWRSPREIIREDVEDEGLRSILDRLAVSIALRESQKNGEPLLDSDNLLGLRSWPSRPTH